MDTGTWLVIVITAVTFAGIGGVLIGRRIERRADR